MATKEENEKIRAGFAAFKKRQAQDRGFTPSAISRQVKLVASANDVSVPKSALDNFLSTYKNVKFGPLQQAIAKFIDSLKSGTPAKPKSVTSTDTRTSPADRFKGLADTQKKAQAKETPKATGKPGPRKKTTVTAAAQEKAARETTRKKKTKDTRKGPVQASSGRFKPVVGVGETGPDKSMPKKTKLTRKGPVQASSGKPKSKPASVGAISQEAAARKRIRDAAKNKKQKPTRKGPAQGSSGKSKPVVGVSETGPDKSMPKAGKRASNRTSFHAGKDVGFGLKGSQFPSNAKERRELMAKFGGTGSRAAKAAMAGTQGNIKKKKS